MLADNMFEFRSQLEEQGVVFCYSGYMTEDVLFGVGDAIKRKLALEEADRRTSHNIFSIFVEQIQNVIRYSAELEADDEAKDELRYGVLTMGKADDKYFLACGNKMLKSDVDRLRGALTRIQSLDNDGLKALYKKTLRDDAPEGSKGAGAGFIEIARRARNGIEFDFSNIDHDHAFFSLKAYV